MINRIINIDVLEGLKTLEDKSVQCIVTSPPYYGLRDYGHAGQIGLEKTPEEYVSKMVEVFREANRVLKNDGTLWLNIGDSYCGSWGNYGGKNRGRGMQRPINNGSAVHQESYDGLTEWRPPASRQFPGLKSKDLIGIPWMLAFAFRADGWYLRQDIIWSKPNPMPESVTDRCTKSHEYIFLLSKSARYYYNAEAIAQPIKDQSLVRLMQDVQNQNGSSRIPGKTNGNMKAVKKRYDKSMAGGGSNINGHSGNFTADGEIIGTDKANKRSVWTVSTMPYKEAHFATFPQELIVDCIKAGSKEGDIILDPFMGAGTTALVASKLGRHYIGFELNAKYVAIAEKRLKKELGLFMPNSEQSPERSVARMLHSTTTDGNQIFNH